MTICSTIKLGEELSTWNWACSKTLELIWIGSWLNNYEWLEWSFCVKLILSCGSVEFLTVKRICIIRVLLIIRKVKLDIKLKYYVLHGREHFNLYNYTNSLPLYFINILVLLSVIEAMPQMADAYWHRHIIYVIQVC